MEMLGIEGLHQRTLRTEDYQIPGREGEFIKLQNLGAEDLAELDRMSLASETSGESVTPMVYAVSRGLREPDGSASGDKPGGYALVAALPPDLLLDIFKRVAALSKIRKQDVEKLQGNSLAGPEDGSSSV